MKIVFIFLIFNIVVFSQDDIYFGGNNKINAKVTEINIDDIVFKTIYNSKDTIIKMDKYYIYKIVYKNGKVEIFNKSSISSKIEFQDLLKKDSTFYIRLAKMDAEKNYRFYKKNYFPLFIFSHLATPLAGLLYYKKVKDFDSNIHENISDELFTNQIYKNSYLAHAKNMYERKTKKAHIMSSFTSISTPILAFCIYIVNKHDLND